MSGIILSVALFMCYGIKEPEPVLELASFGNHVENEIGIDKPKKLTKSEKFELIYKTVLKEYASNGGFFISTLTVLSMKVLLIALT